MKRSACYRILKKRTQFLAISRAGVAVPTPGFLLQALAKEALPSLTAEETSVSTGVPLVGFTTSRKTGKAVERNFLRRRLKEAALQSFDPSQHAGYGFVIIGRQRGSLLQFAQLVADMRRASRKAIRLLENRNDNPSASQRDDRQQGNTEKQVEAIPRTAS